MNKIVFKIEAGEDVEIFANDGENLLELARKANVAIDAPCSGNGSCGKCKIRLVDGTLESAHTRHITEEEYDGGWRLACVSKVNGDAVIAVPDIASAYRNRMKVADLSSPEEIAVFKELTHGMEKGGLKIDCGIKSYILQLPIPSLDDTMPDNERITRALIEASGIERVLFHYYHLKNLPDVLRDNDFKVRVVVEEKNDSLTILDILPGDDTIPACGVAIDIGTTTVSAILVDLETDKILSKASSGNGQIRYGADVINRIIEQQKPNGIKRLKDAVIKETIIPLLENMCDDAKVTKDRIYRMTMASNTTMNHLFLGINANPLRMEPYIPAFFSMPSFFTRNIGINLAPVTKMGIAPNIGSYVGGDITAGTLATMMWKQPDLSLLIDLGTNGEIVFGNEEFLMSCACSAGPAFEGGDISCGMRATVGAIDSLKIDPETYEISYSVIGNGKPVGLCGSGLIDTIAELFKAGIINGKGKFSKDLPNTFKDEYEMGNIILVDAENTESGMPIILSEVDLDNFIRAKGAIFSAIRTLLASVGFSVEDLEHIMVAGGIGSGINIENAIAIGMLPDIDISKYEYIGNSSLTGAYACLVSNDASKQIRELSKTMTYLELSVEPGYMDEFIAACFLPHTDTSLFPSVG